MIFTSILAYFTVSVIWSAFIRDKYQIFLWHMNNDFEHTTPEVMFLLSINNLVNYITIIRIEEFGGMFKNDWAILKCKQFQPMSLFKQSE